MGGDARSTPPTNPDGLVTSFVPLVGPGVETGGFRANIVAWPSAYVKMIFGIIGMASFVIDVGTVSYD